MMAIDHAAVRAAAGSVPDPEIRRRVEAVPGVGSCEVVLRDHFLRERIQQLINAGRR